jgi:CdiI immunity protein
LTTHRLPRPADLPALAAFARAYLHEDLIAEYGSAPKAAAAFAQDASADERRQLLADLNRLLHALAHYPANRAARYFTKELHASWSPGSADDVRSLVTAIESVEIRQPGPD